MNGLQIRINKITEILSSESSKQDKALLSLQAFSGMELTHFSQKKMKYFYKYISAINEITSYYPKIVIDNDYRSLSDRHLNEILKNVQQLCLKLLID
jgi:hypothetical protein